ncbi:MAG: EAL domain-containing protein [Polyangiaceae bacterium]|nr:EAL domain-containing protein [Polyangiaceae bacterium]
MLRRSPHGVFALVAPIAKNGRLALADAIGQPRAVASPGGKPVSRRARPSEPPSERFEEYPPAPLSNRLSDAPSARPPFPSDPEPSTAPGRRDAHRDSYLAIRQVAKPEDLRVVFQPIIDLWNGRLFAYEALVRCRHSSPPELFERAHAAGCVGRLGRMVREIAVPLSAGRPIFLNVHPGELNEPWLVRPDDPMFFHDHDVFLEITESVPLLHFDRCIQVLRELRVRGGVHLVVDDLGAGYSNLKSIADLEPRVVKLDRGLIAGIHQNRRQERLVSGVIRICHDLGATVVAEGIEVHAEYQVLRDAGAHLGQGYLFARPGFPMPAVTWPPEAGKDAVA